MKRTPSSNPNPTFTYKLASKISTVKTRMFDFFRVIYKRSTSTILGAPVRSFLVVIILLTLVVTISAQLTKPPAPVTPPTPPTKAVELFGVGISPKISVIAKVEKTGVLQIVAQTSGIVQKINKIEGQNLYRGEQLFWLSTNYQGGTIPTVSRQLAQKNYDFVKENYDTQKEIIKKRRDLANAVDTQSDNLRDITSKSIEDTKGTIATNEDILNTLNAQLDVLITGNSTGENDTAILQTKQAKAGVQSALNSLRQALRNSEYQSNGDNAPAAISNQQKDLTNKQLDLEEKSLDLNKEISQLNLRIAQISEALMYPATPVEGTIERIHVQFGQNVTPGTILATVRCPEPTVNLIVRLPKETAKSMSQIEPSVIHISGKTLEITPRYVSHEATDGTLYTAFYTIAKEHSSLFTQSGSVSIDIPVGQPGSTGSVPMVPLDALYQTSTDSYVFIASPSATGTMIAQSKKVETGEVYGRYISINAGITANDQVIVSRTVIDGDTVTNK